MGVLLDTATVFNFGTTRQSLSDLIFIVSPYDSPTVDSVSRAATSQPVYNWSTDSLAAVSTSGALPEGGNFTSSNLSNSATQTPTLNVGYTQINFQNATVSKTAEKSVIAGMQSPMSYEILKAARQLKRNIESIASGNQPAVVGSYGVARNSESFGHAIYTNVFAPTTPAGGTPFAAGGLTSITTADTQCSNAAGTYVYQSYSESLFNQGIQAVFNQGGKSSVLVCDMYTKHKHTSFTGRTSSRSIVPEKDIYGTVDIYASDIGDVMLLPSRFSNQVYPGQAILYDTAMTSIVFFRNFDLSPLPVTADAKQYVVVSEWGCRTNNQLANARFVQLATSLANDPSPSSN
jgi:hypothetical protein